MVMNLYRGVDRTRLQFDFIANAREAGYSHVPEITGLGGKVFFVPALRPYNVGRYIAAWKKHLLQHPEWRIIHGHHTSTAFIYLTLAKAFGRVTIAHSHTAGGGFSLKSLLKRLVRYPLRYLAGYLAACSKDAAKWMFGSKANKAFILKNSIDTAQYAFNAQAREEKRKELQLGGRFVIGHVGRFHRLKNHSFLLKTFKEVRAADENAVLLLVGDGKLRGKLEKRVNEPGLTGSVVFTGMRNDVPQLLQAMDVFVFPSVFEGIPMALIEAQACGLPCIVSQNVHPQIKITDGLRFISLQKPPNEWAKAVLALKNRKRSDSSGEVKRAGYDMRENAKSLESFYQSLIQRSLEGVLDKIPEERP